MTLDEYLQKKAIEQLVRLELSVIDYEERIAHGYDACIVAAKKEIVNFFARYATDNKVAYADSRKRLTEAERKELNALLRKWYQYAVNNKLSSDYKTFLSDMGKMKYITRTEYLNACIRYEVESVKSQEEDDYVPLIRTGYMYAYYSTYYAISVGVHAPVPYEPLPDVVVERFIKTRWNSSNYSDRIWKDKARLLDAIEKLIPRSVAQGRDSKQIGDEIAKDLGVSRSNARRLARTEMNRANNQAALEAYKTAGIKKYKFLATLDMRTSEICRSLDGFIGPVSQAVVDVNYPPMHPNCRSTTVPYFEDMETSDTADRIARDEEGNNITVSRRMTQEEWIRKYVPKDDQEELLEFMKKYGDSSKNVE